MRDGRDTLFDVDWQGGQQIRASALGGHVVSIFVLPPSLPELERRLRGRGQDSDVVIAGRMLKSRSEISHWAEYDYVLVNDDLDETANPGDDDQPETTAPLASLDAGLFFERELADNTYLQTLEPRLFYVYSEYEEDQAAQPLFDTSHLTFNYGQLFRERRFNGYR